MTDLDVTRAVNDVCAVVELQDARLALKDASARILVLEAEAVELRDFAANARAILLAVACVAILLGLWVGRMTKP